MKRNERRGFTLIEIVLVVAIIAVIATVTIIAFGRSKANYDLNNTARSLVSDLRHARSIAQTGRRPPSATPGPAVALTAPPPSSPSVRSAPSSGPTAFVTVSALRAVAVTPVLRANQRVVSAGIRVTGTKSYEVFVDTDSQPGGEIAIERVRLPMDTPLYIVAPPVGSLVRFRANGTRHKNSPRDLTVRNSETGKLHNIRVDLGGASGIE